MSEKKIVVPEGMHRAAVERLLLYENFRVDAFEPNTSTPEQQANGRASVVLEAALRWQSNRSPDISPELLGMLADDAGTCQKTAYDIVDMALRRMYLAPEPEIGSVAQDIIDRMRGVTLSSMEADAIVDELSRVAHGWSSHGWSKHGQKPEVPKEIKDLLWDKVPNPNKYDDPVSLHNTLVLAGYIRGRKSKTTD